MAVGKYSENSVWQDVVPLPQDDLVPQPLVTIMYPEEYVEATSYLRAVMAANEMSSRVLDLTADVIRLSPAHYTVWIYRFKTLLATHSDLKAEIEWLNPLAIKHQKNYQIWHHRQSVIGALGSWDGEHTFIGQVLELDSKNYHVWSYRQWAVSKFKLWDDVQEWKFTESMIDSDVRNNSAWNHRWYLAFGKPGGAGLKDKTAVDREVNYAIEKIKLAPQNESPWNLLRALYEKASGPAALSWPKLAGFAKTFSGKNGEDVKSSHALDVLAWALAEQEGHEEEACAALEQLATKWDPIRANYWRWRKSLVNSGRQPHQATTVAA